MWCPGLNRNCVCRYGPFWVATTLVFVIAATGNYANYVSYKKKHSGSSSTLTVWYSNVDKVQAASAAPSQCTARMPSPLNVGLYISLFYMLNLCSVPFVGGQFVDDILVYMISSCTVLTGSTLHRVDLSSVCAGWLLSYPVLWLCWCVGSPVVCLPPMVVQVQGHSTASLVYIRYAYCSGLCCFGALYFAQS